MLHENRHDFRNLRKKDIQIDTSNAIIEHRIAKLETILTDFLKLRMVTRQAS